MNSIKCAACGFVGWDDVENCKKCGAKLVPHSASGPDQVQGFGPGARGPRTELKQGLAIAALVVGMMNLLTLGLLGLGAILGITLGIVALRRISKQPSVYGGKVFATAGLVTSILSLAMLVGIGLIAAISIPNLIASRRAANEGSTIQAMRQIAAAEHTYSGLHGAYGTLEQLAAEELINRGIAAGSRHGYRIKIDLSRPESGNRIGGYQVVAVPLTYPNSGRRSFYIDETGVIRGGDAHGKDATKDDDPLNETDSSDGSPPPRRDPEY